MSRLSPEEFEYFRNVAEEGREEAVILGHDIEPLEK